MIFVSDGSSSLPAGYYAIQIKRSATSIVIDYTGAAGNDIGSANITAYTNANPTPDTVRLDNGSLTIDDTFLPSGRRVILSGGFTTAYAEVIEVLDSLLGCWIQPVSIAGWLLGSVFDPNPSTIIVNRIISSMSPLSYAGELYQIKWTLDGWSNSLAVTDSVCFPGRSHF